MQTDHYALYQLLNKVTKLRQVATLASCNIDTVKHVTIATKYLLFPISMMTMLELECWRASSSHVVK